jgi:hypothetical protein
MMQFDTYLLSSSHNLIFSYQHLNLTSLKNTEYFFFSAFFLRQTQYFTLLVDQFRNVILSTSASLPPLSSPSSPPVLSGNFHLKNLSMHAAENEEAALELLFMGDTNRAIAETPMNMVIAFYFFDYKFVF